MPSLVSLSNEVYDVKVSKMSLLPISWYYLPTGREGGNIPTPLIRSKGHSAIGASQNYITRKRLLKMIKMKLKIRVYASMSIGQSKNGYYSQRHEKNIKKSIIQRILSHQAMWAKNNINAGIYCAGHFVAHYICIN